MLHSIGARRQRGASLVELVVSLGLGALTLALSATSVLALALGEQSASAATELAATMDTARVEAALRRAPIGICGIDAAQADAPAGELRCAESTWTGGWLVFVDGNNNRRVDDGETVLKVQRSRRIHVHMSHPTDDMHAVAFRPTGTLAHPTAVRLAVHAAARADQGARNVCVGVDGHVQLVAASMPCR